MKAINKKVTKPTAMGTIDKRNLRAKLYVLNELGKAKLAASSKPLAVKFTSELAILKMFVPIPANGFRGIVLTSIVAIYLDKDFDPTVDFYKCNPRSIFEKGIFYALRESSIPCGKSDPLNVAKNTQEINSSWAKGKRPESAAIAAVDYINLLLSAKSTKRYDDLVSLFFKELYNYGIYVNSQNISISHSTSVLSPAIMANKLSDFVINCSEGGAVTQYVVGLLIYYLRANNSDYASIEGYSESVFGTNTTSKKPADIWEILTNGELGNLYEITVKVIDGKRLDDCVENIHKLELQHLPVTFICNMPNDISTLTNVCNNCLTHKGIAIQFVDIRGYLLFIYISLTAELRKLYLASLQMFVSDINRSIKTKHYWRDNFS